MSFHDPTDPPGTSISDGQSQARTPPEADDATCSGAPDPAGGTLAAPERIGEIAAILAGHGTGTIERMLAEPSDLPTSTLPSDASSPSPAAVAPTVPDYELLELLGEGGMGIVWKARQTNLNRLVAVKMVLGEERVGSKGLIRFLAEAEAVAAVKHPHVVQVYDYGEAGGRPFLAMEYLSGGSLTDRLKQDGRLDPKGAADLVGTLAGAVQAAHDLGIVHRDMKPGNVLFDDRGTPKVTDFGLAKRAGGSDLTATQVVMGTPAYMAPEQARGDTKFVGPQADVYSLGVILYECLTGTKPFQASDELALLRQVVEEEPERPGRLAPGVPRDVELICLKCLAKDPAERYQTAEALAADLARFAAGEPVSVRAAGVVERVARWARRKPTLAAAYTLGLLTVLLGGLGGVAIWQWRAAERARAEAERLRVLADTARGREADARGEAERQRELSQRFDYGSKVQLAHLHCQMGGRVSEFLFNTRPDLRGWEYDYVKNFHLPSLLSHSKARVVRDNKGNFRVLGADLHTAAVKSATFSPNGSRVLTVTQDGTAWVWDAPGRANVYDHMDVPVLKLRAAVNSATFSPDGSRILTGSQVGTAQVWDAQSGALILELKGYDLQVMSWGDGSKVPTSGHKLVIAGTNSDGLLHIRTFDAAGVRTEAYEAIVGKALHLVSADAAGHVRPLSGGSEVAILKKKLPGLLPPHVLTHDEDTQVRGEVESITSQAELRGFIRAVTSVTFSPDGSRVLTVSDNGKARFWDAKTGAEVLDLEGGAGPATFSPDGSVFFTLGSGVAVWDAQTGQRLGHVGFSNGSHGSSATFFSLDGLRVVGRTDSGAAVWDAASGQVLTQMYGVVPISATFSPGGSRVVTGSLDGSVHVWDAQSGALVLELKGHTKAVTSVTFSPDGSCLLTGSEDGTARIWYAGMTREWTGSYLQLMSWGDGSGVPTDSPHLVIVGTDSDDLLHIRDFDGGVRIDTFETRDTSGALHLKSVESRFRKVLSDTLESSLLATQSGAIMSLKQHLPGLLPPHVLSGAETEQVLSAVTLSLGSRQVINPR
jgi:WD40 repeat protein/tRNA A-37 threonylcarbamoyl transferase component Bud32